MALIQVNKVGASPEFFEVSEFAAGGLAIGAFFSTWPLSWLVFMFNDSVSGAKLLWTDMWSGGVINFIVCNIVLYIKSWCLLVVNIIFGIFSFIF